MQDLKRKALQVFCEHDCDDRWYCASHDCPYEFDIDSWCLEFFNSENELKEYVSFGNIRP